MPALEASASAIPGGVPGANSRMPLVSLAWRESRSTRRRLLLYMSSISLGVAALVAIDSFAGNVTRSVRAQSRALLGGDVAFSARQGAWTPGADSLLDSWGRSGLTVARQTNFASMALVPRTAGTRLAQVRAVSATYPLYGEVTTVPAGRWDSLQTGRFAIVDPSLLIALDAQVGDTLTLGFGKFVILATLASVPGDPGISAAMAPRVYMPARYVGETKLLTFGSRVNYEAFVKLGSGTDPVRWLAQATPRLDSLKMRARTVADAQSSITDAIDQLANFLGLVGIVALLLGGVGVASGINAWVARKIDIVAVLRCVGATSRQVLLIYATQAAAMGFVGAAMGAVLGIAIQFALHGLLKNYLPLDVTVRLEPRAIATGVTLGVWIALAFALRPLIALRRVSPLQAIRRNVSTARRSGHDWVLWLVNAFIASTVVAIAGTRATSWRGVVGFSAGIAGVLALLLLSALLLSRLARGAVRGGWPYVIRQGVANLYRPANQTRPVILSLGFGAFLVTTLYLVQSNLLKQLTITEEASRGNLIFFDVQDDQGPGVDSLVQASGVTLLQRTPMVTMRIAAVNGKVVAPLTPDSIRARMADSSGGDRGRGRRSSPGDGGWALRREYRSTYRDTLFTGEKLAQGKWFGATAVPPGKPGDELSLESDIAGELGVSLGDVITWDVQGVKVDTRLTSLRTVNWARFEPNFYAIFQSRTLAKAPRTFVVLAASPNAPAAGRVQRAVVQRYPNVASIDLSLVRKTVGDISRRATLAIRFLALFSLAMGVPVLFSSVAATRRERVREGVLLKTLGATRAQIGRILLSEYTLLGLLGSLTGLVLSFGGAWAIMRWIFERPFAAASAQAFGIAGAMMLMAVLIGVLSGRDVFRETAMTALREV